MKHAFFAIYFERRDEALDDYKGISDVGKKAMLANFRGDIVAANELYSHWQPECEPDQFVSCMLAADMALVRTKLGEKFEIEYPELAMGHVASRYIIHYARYSSFFWIDHSIAWQALWKLLAHGILLRSKFACAMPLFLVGHMMAIQTKRKIGLSLARYFFKLFRKADRVEPAPPFFRNIVYAAYPYTLLVSAKVLQIADTMMELNDRIPHDPYYQGIFRASCLYAFAYSRDIVRTEVFSEQLLSIHNDPRIVRYAPLAKVMVFMPVAMRGYGHLIRDSFQGALQAHQNEKTDNLINSQFYRSAAVTALCLNDKLLSQQLLDKATYYRNEAKSFRSWKLIDDRIQYLISRPQDFDPSLECVLGSADFSGTSPMLATFMMELITITPQVGFGTVDFAQKVRDLLLTHLDLENIGIVTKAPDLMQRQPILKVDNRYLIAYGVPKERLVYIEKMFSSLAPTLKALELTVDRIDRLKDELRKNSQLAAIGKTTQLVAHDVRRPFSILSTGIQMLRKDANQDRRSYLECLDNLERELNQSLYSVNNVLDDITSIGRQRRLEQIPTRFGDVVDDMMRHLKGVISDDQWAQIQMPSKKDSEIVILCNRSAIVRVLANLIENALHASTINDSVRIALARRQEGVVEISVHNSGSYIDSEIRSNLFSPFYTSKTKGTGLGLAIVKKIVNEHGFDVTCDSSAEFGTTFTFGLSEQLESSQLTQLKERSLRVAVVEDNFFFRQAWEKTFAVARSDTPAMTGQSQHQLYTYDRPEAFFAEGCDTWDIIVTDRFFDNSKLTGLDLAEQVKREFPSTPPMILSTNSTTNEQDGRLFTCVIGKKPMDIDALLKATYIF